ncbi:uncharacterized protein ARMOST_01462 [Armillaria ostoyae]|uniref:Uncharacterized protein n=1 Tax=Armillaria ostoyae TaxID=47428 RepID=A0A284QP18_ARMOS|nr:uncharacterized protein ARMOST_01462 [Armillaria ostoyae]
MADFSQHPASGKYLTDNGISEVASKLRIADPDKDNGAFNTMNRKEAVIWLKCKGASGLSPLKTSALLNEEVIEKLRYALWDFQRIDSLFHGKTFLAASKLNVTAFPAWPNWEKIKRMLVRSSYIEGRPKDGSQFTLFLESKIEKNMPRASAKQRLKHSRPALTMDLRRVNSGIFGNRWQNIDSRYDLADQFGSFKLSLEDCSSSPQALWNIERPASSLDMFWIPGIAVTIDGEDLEIHG